MASNIVNAAHNDQQNQVFSMLGVIGTLGTADVQGSALTLPIAVDDATGAMYVKDLSGATGTTNVQVLGGTLNAGTVTVGAINSIGTLGTMQVGTITSIPNIPGGTIGVVSSLTTGNVSATVVNGTVTSVGTTVGVGTITNIGTVNTAGTILALPNLPGGTIGVVSSLTTGNVSATVVNGTITNVGTTVGVGTITQIGTINTAGTILALPNLPGGTIGVVSSLTSGSLSNVAMVNAATISSIPNIPGGTIGVVSSLTTGSLSNLALLNAGTLTALGLGTVYKGVAASTAGSLTAAGTISIAGSQNDLLAIDIGGTWVGTSFFEGQIGTSVWFGLPAVTNTGIIGTQTTANGEFFIDATSLSNARVRHTFNSGTLTYNVQPSNFVDSIISIWGGTLTNIGTLGVLNAGTLTTIPNIPGGTVGVVSSLTTGNISATVVTGTIVNSGTTTGVGTITNVGTIALGTVQPTYTSFSRYTSAATTTLKSSAGVIHALTGGYAGNGTLYNSAGTSNSIIWAGGMAAQASQFFDLAFGSCTWAGTGAGTLTIIYS